MRLSKAVLLSTLVSIAPIAFGSSKQLANKAKVIVDIREAQGLGSDMEALQIEALQLELGYWVVDKEKYCERALPTQSFLAEKLLRKYEMGAGSLSELSSAIQQLSVVEKRCSK